MSEQRYKPVLAVIADGRTVGEVAKDWGVCRQTMQRWQARYEGEGLEGLGARFAPRAHRPHQTPCALEVMVSRFVAPMLLTVERGESPLRWLAGYAARTWSVPSEVRSTLTNRSYPNPLVSAK